MQEYMILHKSVQVCTGLQPGVLNWRCYTQNGGKEEITVDLKISHFMFISGRLQRFLSIRGESLRHHSLYFLHFFQHFLIENTEHPAFVQNFSHSQNSRSCWGIIDAMTKNYKTNKDFIW